MKKFLKKIDERHLWLILVVSYSLRMVERSILDVVNHWILIFGIINIIIGCVLLFQTLHNGVSYIPPGDDVFTIKIPFLFGHTLTIFTISVEHLYNKLKKWEFGITIFALAIMCLSSILMLLYDFILFFHII